MKCLREFYYLRQNTKVFRYTSGGLSKFVSRLILHQGLLEWTRISRCGLAAVIRIVLHVSRS